MELAARAQRRRGGPWTISTALGLALLGSGCAAVQVKDSLARAEHKLTRHAVAGYGVEMHATLWDEALVTTALRDDTAPEGRPAGAAQWHAHYLDRTSFTVVVELEHRLPEIPKADLMATKAWQFRLDRGQERGLQPADVQLVLVDRFPTIAKGYHHRLVFVVHFDGSLAQANTGAKQLKLRLHVVPNPPSRTTRSMIGQSLHRRGTTLRWRVKPA